MRQAVVARSTAGRVCDNAVSIHVSNSPRFQPVAASSRRSILLGLAAGVAGLAYDAKKARAAAPLLSGNAHRFEVIKIMVDPSHDC